MTSKWNIGSLLCLSINLCSILCLHSFEKLPNETSFLQIRREQYTEMPIPQRLPFLRKYLQQEHIAYHASKARDIWVVKFFCKTCCMRVESRTMCFFREFSNQSILSAKWLKKDHHRRGWWWPQIWALSGYAIKWSRRSVDDHDPHDGSPHSSWKELLFCRQD